MIGQPHDPAALPPRNEPSASTGFQGRSVHFVERTKILTVPGLEPRLEGRLDGRPVTVLSQGDFSFEIKLRGQRRVKTNLRCHVSVVCRRNGCRSNDASDINI